METRWSTARGGWVVSSAVLVRSDVSCRLGEVLGEQLSVEVDALPVDRLLLGDLCWVCVGLSLAMFVLLMLRWYLALAGGLFLVVSRCGWA